MNKDQVEGSVEGSARAAAGKVQWSVGEVVGNPAWQARGASKELPGKAQQVLGDGKELDNDAERRP